MKQIKLLLILLFLIITLACAHSQALSDEEMGIMVNNQEIVLGDDISYALEVLGSKYETRVISKSDDDVSEYDQLILTYEQLKIGYIRRSQRVIVLKLLDPNIKTIGGHKIGMNIEEVKKSFTDARLYDNKLFVSIESDGIEKVILYHFDDAQIITSITISLLVP